MRNLPVYADSLIADLNYPLAWGNSDVKDFDAWRKVARQKVTVKDHFLLSTCYTTMVLTSLSARRRSSVP